MASARPTVLGQRHSKAARAESPDGCPAHVAGRPPKASEANVEAAVPPPAAARYEGTEGDWATTFNMLKAIMGAGGFALPWAFARTGLVGGCVAVGGCAVLGAATVRELVGLKAHVELERGRPGATYVDVAWEAFGGIGASLVYVLSLVCSLGVTSAYLVFIGATLHSLVPSVSQGWLVLVTAATVLPASWLQDFSLLSRLSEYGTYAVVLGYGVTLGYAAAGAAGGAGPSRAPAPAPAPPPSLASAARGFGPVAFLFCVHFLLFPVMTASRAAARTGGFERLAAAAFTVAGVVNAGFAVAGLLGFGGRVSSIVINDIAGGTWYLVVTKILLCVDLFCSYPLVLASGRQIVEQSLILEDMRDSGAAQEGSPVAVFDGISASAAARLGFALALVLPSTNGRRRLVRTGLVLITVLVAQLRDFGTIISLVGSFAQVSMAFVLPPLMSLRLLAADMAPVRLLTNLAVLPLGCTVAVLATGTTLAEALGHGWGQ